MVSVAAEGVKSDVDGATRLASNKLQTQSIPSLLACPSCERESNLPREPRTRQGGKPDNLASRQGSLWSSSRLTTSPCQPFGDTLSGEKRATGLTSRWRRWSVAVVGLIHETMESDKIKITSRPSRHPVTPPPPSLSFPVVPTPLSSTVVAGLFILKLVRGVVFHFFRTIVAKVGTHFHICFFVDSKCCDFACGRPSCCCVRRGSSSLLSRFAGHWRTALLVGVGGEGGVRVLRDWLHGWFALWEIFPIQADESKWCGTKSKTLKRDSCCVRAQREIELVIIME